MFCTGFGAFAQTRFYYYFNLLMVVAAGVEPERLLIYSVNSMRYSDGIGFAQCLRFHPKFSSLKAAYPLWQSSQIISNANTI